MNVHNTIKMILNGAVALTTRTTVRHYFRCFITSKNAFTSFATIINSLVRLKITNFFPNHAHSNPHTNSSRIIAMMGIMTDTTKISL